MFVGGNPEKMLRQLGIKAKKLNGVKEVVIVMETGKILLRDAEVVEMSLPRGNAKQHVYQITPKDVERLDYTEEDIAIVSEEAHVSKELAEEFLKKAKGDVAEAILLAQESSSQDASQDGLE